MPQAFRHGPYRQLGAVTAIALLVSGCQATAFLHPISEQCIEWCDMGRLVAAAVISVVTFGWLLAYLAIAWRARDTSPGIPIVAALASAVVLTLWWEVGPRYGHLVMSNDDTTYGLHQIAFVAAVGLPLPAIWRLTAPARPAVVGGATAAVGIVCAVGSIVVSTHGSNFLGETPDTTDVLFMALGLSASLGIVLAWRQLGPERWPAAVVAIAGPLYVAVDGWLRLVPGPYDPLVLWVPRLLAAGWLVVGVVWLMSPLPERRAAT